jgi:hypothetical protein
MRIGRYSEVTVVASSTRAAVFPRSPIPSVMHFYSGPPMHLLFGVGLIERT